jgi:membrane-associated phospholipid phosphatase
MPSFLVRLPAPADISVNVAVAAAAHAVLVHLFPSRRAVLDGALAAALVHEPAGPALAQAVSFGEAVADAVIMLRDADGSMAMGTSRAGVAPGEWRPTPPDFQPASHPQWARMRPFTMTEPNQFRPAGPPAPGTAAFRQARAVVAGLGEARSATRTAEQTEIAHYWSDALGTYAPAGHWNAIAANFVAPFRLGTAVEAELFTELNVAMADAGIAMADAKYTYWLWRPITAIRSGDDVTPPVPDWTSLLDTPNHPSYISGHSSFSGAAATVLTAWFGARPFTFASTSVPGVTRHFTSFQQAADEAAASRVYGGIHFPFDNADGLATGRSVGAWTMAVFQKMAEDRGPVIMMMDPSMPMANVDPSAVVGCALDNLSPVAAVTVRLDGDAPFSVAVNDRGLFTLPADRIGPSRRHAVMLTATSVSGRSSTVQVRID